MRGYLMRLCVAAAAGVALSTVGVAGASASGAAPLGRQSVRMSPAGPGLAAASPGAQLWAKRYNGTGNNNDLAKAVAASPDGKTVYVTGQSYGTTGVVDYATVGYDAATGAQRWVARYNGPSGSLSNVPSAVAVSPDGKTVYVTGTTRVGQFGDYATVAYDAATGHQRWAKGYNGPLNNDDEATAVAVSPASGTVYVTGFSWGTATGSDYATIAYAASGAQLWVKRYNGPAGNGNDNANAVVVNPATGTVYVTGESTGSCCSGGDYTTVAYTASGAQKWVARYNGPGNGTDDATSVAVSPATGTVYVTGYSWGTSNTPDYATIAYTASGTKQWVARYNGPDNYYDQATSVAVSPATGAVFVTGKSTGTGTGYDYATIAYAPAGKQLWIQRYNGPGSGNDIATSLAVSPTGQTVYVTGQSVATTGVFDYATIGYKTASGAQQWIKHPVGSELYPNSMTVSPATGTVFVTGANAGDYITIAYSG